MKSINSLRSASELAQHKPHGTRIKYLGGCKCVPCRAAASRYECERAAKRKCGLGNELVETGTVIAHLQNLSAKGVGYKAVCDAAGVGKSSVMEVMQGRRTRMRAANARAILAVTFDMAVKDGAYIDATETKRQIRWLLNEGFTRGQIAKRLGYKTANLQFSFDKITARNAMKIERLVSQLRLGE